MKSAAQDGLSKRFSLSRISAISLFPSGSIWAWRWQQQPGPFLGTPVSSKPGTLQGFLGYSPHPSHPQRDQLLGGVVGMGLVSSQTSSGLWPPQRSPRIGPSGGPKTGKWSHLIQKKSVELRFNERGRECRQQAAFADCLPPRRESRKGITSKENPPGTLGDSSLGCLDENVRIVMASQGALDSIHPVDAQGSADSAVFWKSWEIIKYGLQLLFAKSHFFEGSHCVVLAFLAQSPSLRPKFVKLLLRLERKNL